MSLPPPADACQPDQHPPEKHPPGPFDPYRPTVILVIIVVTFAGLLLALGYDLHAAVAGAGGAGLVAVEVARRALHPRHR
jgi:hypothetical protein